MSLLGYISHPAGLAYMNLVYDWVKAAVMFGIINTVSQLDHLDPPKPPKCITMLYVFSETSVRTPLMFFHLFNVFTTHEIMKVDFLFKGILIEESTTGSASKSQKIIFSICNVLKDHGLHNSEFTTKNLFYFSKNESPFSVNNYYVYTFIKTGTIHFLSV